MAAYTEESSANVAAVAEYTTVVSMVPYRTVTVPPSVMPMARLTPMPTQLLQMLKPKARMLNPLMSWATGAGMSPRSATSATAPTSKSGCEVDVKVF